MINRVANASIGAVVLIRLLRISEGVSHRGRGVLVVILYLIKGLIDGYLIVLIYMVGNIIPSIYRKLWLN